MLKQYYLLIVYLSRIATMVKQNVLPAADNIRETLQPRQSTVRSGINEPNKYISKVPPPNISDAFRDKFIII